MIWGHHCSLPNCTANPIGEGDCGHLWDPDGTDITDFNQTTQDPGVPVRPLTRIAPGAEEKEEES